MTQLWAAIWYGMLTGPLPPGVPYPDLSPKSVLIYTSEKACRDSLPKTPEGPARYYFEDGHSVPIPVKSVHTCAPAYVSP